MKDSLDIAHDILKFYSEYSSKSSGSIEKTGLRMPIYFDDGESRTQIVRATAELIGDTWSVVLSSKEDPEV